MFEEARGVSEDDARYWHAAALASWANYILNVRLINVELTLLGESAKT